MQLRPMNLENLRLGLANFTAWAFAAISMSDVLTLFQIIAAFGGICVSAASVWYIRKKGKALDMPKD